EARRARTPGISEVGQRLLGDGERTGRLRLLGSGLRPVWLLPRLWLEGSAADPRRQRPVRAAYQGAKSFRHRRGRVRGALTASGALTLMCRTRGTRSPSSELDDETHKRASLDSTPQQVTDERRVRVAEPM